MVEEIGNMIKATDLKVQDKVMVTLESNRKQIDRLKGSLDQVKIKVLESDRDGRNRHDELNSLVKTTASLA